MSTQTRFNVMQNKYDKYLLFKLLPDWVMYITLNHQGIKLWAYKPEINSADEWFNIMEGDGKELDWINVNFGDNYYRDCIVSRYEDE